MTNSIQFIFMYLFVDVDDVIKAYNWYKEIHIVSIIQGLVLYLKFLNSNLLHLCVYSVVIGSIFISIYSRNTTKI